MTTMPNQPWQEPEIVPSSDPDPLSVPVQPEPDVEPMEVGRWRSAGVERLAGSPLKSSEVSSPSFRAT